MKKKEKNNFCVFDKFLCEIHIAKFMFVSSCRIYLSLGIINNWMELDVTKAYAFQTLRLISISSLIRSSYVVTISGFIKFISRLSFLFFISLSLDVFVVTSL